MEVEYKTIKDLPPDVVEEYREAFSLFDEDGDQSITTRELAGVLKSLGQNPSEKHIAEMIRDVDQDGNGMVDFEEFLNMMIKSMSHTDTDDSLRESYQMFLEFSASGEEGLSANSLRAIMAAMGEKLTQEEAVQMVLLADTDEDGFVNFEEFCALMKSI